MEILTGIGGLVFLLFAIKAIVFLPNKVYLQQVLGALRAKGAYGLVDMLEASTAGKLGQEMATAAWKGLIDSRVAGVSPEDCARDMIADSYVD